MKYIKYIHWDAKEAEENAKRFQGLPYQVDWSVPDGPSFFREVKTNPPVAVLIDLARLPSQGRDIALTLRKTATTRDIPIIFLDGDPVKVSKIRELLPDAMFTQREKLKGNFRTFLKNKPENPVVPESVFAGYSGKPLYKKLGIKEGMTVLLQNPPENVESILDDLPENVNIIRDKLKKQDLILWFCRSRNDLKRKIAEITSLMMDEPVWIAWPKKSGEMNSDLTQQIVRDSGLAAGLVDYKICSIDSNWSGLLFTKRS